MQDCMTGDLFSLRAILVSADHVLCDLFQHAAAASAVPAEIAEADDAAAARASLAGADLVYVDGALPGPQITQIVAAARAADKPPFTLHLATSAIAQSFDCDGLAGRPVRPDQASWLLERSMRVRLPSRVLVVDDSATIRAIVRKALAGTRFPLDVSEAETGIAALQLVRENDFNIVFLDHYMPDFSGLETLAEIKREGRDVHVVLMTSAQDTVAAKRARSHGASFLKKPFFPADIEAVLCGFYGLRALNPKRS
jgi:CheY-like chemotaxis protein